MSRSFKLAAVLVLAAVLAGCGGGGSKTGEVGVPGSSGGTGRASISIKWPAATRLIPATAESIVIDIKSGTRTLAHKVIVRPSAGSTSVATFDSLPEGDLLVIASACPYDNGSGTPVAKGSAILTIVDGQESSIKITMDSTVETLEITHSDTGFVQVGQNLQLYPLAKDSNGYNVVIADESLRWSSSDLSVATIDSTGKVTATGLGTTQISLADTESGKQGSSRISTILNVSTDPQPQLLALNMITNKIYATHSGDGGAITEIDGATDTSQVLAHAPAGYTLNAIAVDSETNRVYAICRAALSSRLILLDGGSGAVLQSADVVDGAEGIAVDESANRVYLTSSSSTDEAVTVIDGTDLHTISTISLPANSTAYAPVKPVLMPSRHTLYVTSIARTGYSGEACPVFTLDTTGSPQLTALNGVTSTSQAIAVDDSKDLVYLCDEDDLVVYTGAGTFVKQVYTGYGADQMDLAVDSSRNRTYLKSGSYYSTKYFDWSKGNSGLGIPIANVESIAINQQTNRFYATVPYSNCVAVVAMPE